MLLDDKREILYSKEQLELMENTYLDPSETMTKALMGNICKLS